MNDVIAIESLLRRLEKVSRRLAKRFADELAQRASEAKPAQIAGWQAMIWRYHAEVGMASIATPVNLVKAAAVLDDFAAGFPEDQRFRLHFTFEIEPPDPAMGPATLAFLSWHYQGRFADSYGRLDRDPEGFGRGVLPDFPHHAVGRQHPAARGDGGRGSDLFRVSLRRPAPPAQLVFDRRPVVPTPRQEIRHLGGFIRPC